jgi:N-acetylmuramoyl-L-alanine amidase CwlA
MNIIGKKLSLADFDKYVKTKDFGILPPTFIVLHHTWKPTKKEWNGAATIQALKKYYEGLGWSAGPHLFIADDGIWLFTDMYDVGIHAGAGNGTLKSGYSIGIEVVGNYDDKLWTGKTKENTLGAIKVLQKKLKISDSKIKFHRDYSSKTCPGKAITKDWVLKQLNIKEETMSEKNHEVSAIMKASKEYLKIVTGDRINSDEDKAIANAIRKLVEDKKTLAEQLKQARENTNVPGEILYEEKLGKMTRITFKTS